MKSDRPRNTEGVHFYASEYLELYGTRTSPGSKTSPEKKGSNRAYIVYIILLKHSHRHWLIFIIPCVNNGRAGMLRCDSDVNTKQMANGGPTTHRSRESKVESKEPKSCVRKYAINKQCICYANTTNTFRALALVDVCRFISELGIVLSSDFRSTTCSM